MNKELKNLLEKDMYRVYGGKPTLKQRILMPIETRYAILWRKASFRWQRYKAGKGGYLMAQLYCRRLQAVTERTGLNIFPTTVIGEGLVVSHLGTVLVHPEAVIGKNFNIGAGVTIGQANRGKRKGVPTIGNEVWIGTNAVLVGKITIGDDVMIAPGTFINFDVPSHSIVMGNPGVIHPSEHATRDYINRKV